MGPEKAIRMIKALEHLSYKKAKAEGAGFIWRGEEKAPERLYTVGGRLFIRECTDRIRGNS